MNQPTSHDAAKTGSEDYTATSGTPTHAAQETSKTVSMPVLAISIDDGGETLKLTLVEPEPVEPIPCHPVSTRILAVHLGVCAAEKGPCRRRWTEPRRRFPWKASFRIS